MENIEEISHSEEKMLKAHFERTGKLLEGCLPFLKAGEGTHVLLQSHALVIGLWSLSNPSTVIREALQEPALRLFEVSFATEFSQTLSALLHGLEYMAQKSEEE